MNALRDAALVTEQLDGMLNLTYTDRIVYQVDADSFIQRMTFAIARAAFILIQKCLHAEMRRDHLPSIVDHHRMSIVDATFAYASRGYRVDIYIVPL